MPEEFDPAWEFYEPDPYVAWVFATSGGVSGMDGVVDGRMYREESLGLRFGKGNPDATMPGRLGRPKPGVESRLLERKTCPKCGYSFPPSRSTQVYCTDECSNLSQVKLCGVRKCRSCGADYKPKRQRQVVCSNSCASKSRHNKLGRLDEFKTMYAGGSKVADIASDMGVSVTTAKEWRRLLNLGPRGPGGSKAVRTGG